MEIAMGSAVHATKKPPTGDEPPIKLFTVADYHRMIDTGILGKDDQCELIHGRIVDKMPPNPPHSSASRRITRRLLPLFPDPDWVFGTNDPITLLDSEPQPDFFAAFGPDSKYAKRHPGPKDLVLVVEVSDSTLGFDRGTKLAMYAGAKIVQYWIVNVPDRRVEVYTQPRGGKNPAYKQQTNYGADQEVPVVVGGRELGRIPVRELLP
jgi:Uma2 family endonuclease